MSIPSQRTIYSILAGMVVGLLLTIFIRPTCWGPVVGIVLASYLAKISTPKDGAMIGAIVVIPIGIYALLQMPADLVSDDTASIPATIAGMILALLLVSGIGALYGLIIGKLFQVMRNKTIIF